MDLDELSSESDSDISFDSDKTATHQSVSARDSTKIFHLKKHSTNNIECSRETDDASDTDHMELHVKSGEEPDTATLSLFYKDGREFGSAMTSGPRLRELLQHQPLRATPFFANPPPVDKNGNLYLGKHHRLKSGTGSLREIRRYQRSTEPLVPKAAFRRLVQEVRSDLHLDCSFSKDAYEALQESAERYCVQIFNLANKMATHSNRVTLQKKDLKLAVEILTEPWDVPGTNNGFSA